MKTSAQKVYEFVLEKAIELPLTARAWIYEDLASIVSDLELAQDLRQRASDLKTLEESCHQMKLKFNLNSTDNPDISHNS